MRNWRDPLDPTPPPEEDVTEPTGDRPAWRLFRFPDPAAGPHLARVWFGQVNGRPAVVGVEAWAVPPVAQGWLPEDLRAAPELGARGPITAEQIRVPLGEWLEKWVATQRHYLAAAVRMPNVDLAAADDLASQLQGRRRGGRQPLGLDFLQKVAYEYQ